MKKIILLLLLLLPLISACGGNSVFYNRIETINENFSFKLYIYGEEITEEKHRDNLPENLNYEYIDTLEYEFDFDGIYVLLITKDVNSEELKKLSSLLMDDTNIIFYDITNYSDELLSDDYDFVKLKRNNNKSTTILFSNLKGPYMGTSDNPTIWSVFDMIEGLLKKYN